LEIIQHKNVLFRDLLRVIDIKNAAWPHPVESQLKWIVENQSSEDFHVILRDSNEDLAYLDLCPVHAVVDGVETEFLGIGNVCTKTHGLGHGGILIKLVNSYLKKSRKRGLLFCKDKVVNFYAHYAWEIVPSVVIIPTDTAAHSCSDVITMVYNTSKVNNIVYKDRDF